MEEDLEMMAWLNYVFCPHSWDKVIAQGGEYDDKATKDSDPISYYRLYQCSKCSRFKRVRY